MEIGSALAVFINRATAPTNSFTMQIRNSIHLIGHIGQDAELINTKSGEQFLKFSLATNEYSRDKEGNKVTRTEWHNITVFGSERAKSLQGKLTKGTHLAINGVLNYRKWTDKHDQKRSDAYIQLEDFAYLSSKEQEQEKAA